MKLHLRPPIAASILGLLGLCTSQGAIIFEDDFSGSTPIGGTRALNNSSSSTLTVQTQISSSSPITPASGGYLNTAVTGGSTNVRLLTYTPTSLANSWEAMVGSTTIGGVNYTTLNGGFDIFTRLNQTDTVDGRLDFHWFRPVDFNGTGTGTENTQAFRLILEGNASGNLVLQLIANGSNLTGTSAGVFNQGGQTINIANYASQLTLGSILHFGFTFQTNPTTGLVTMSLFGRNDAGAIDTTSSEHLLGTKSFYISELAATVNHTRSIFGGLRSWDMLTRDSNSDFLNHSIDYDQVRLYAGLVTGFDALPVPEPSRAVLTLLSLSTLLMLNRKRC